MKQDLCLKEASFSSLAVSADKGILFHWRLNQ